MSHGSYTNRRGHKLVLKDEELSSLRIDDQPAASGVVTPVTTIDAAEGSGQKKEAGRVRSSPPSRASSPRSRRWPIVTLTVVVLLIVSALSAGELVRARYIAEAETSGKVAAIARKTMDESQSADRFSPAIDEISTLQGQMCQGGFTDNMADLYPRARDGLQQCREARSRVAALADAMRTARAEDSYLTQLQSLLKRVVDGPEGQFAVLSAQVDHWKAIDKKLSESTPPESFMAAHAAITETAGRIQGEWIKLSAAHNNQDKSAFVAARDRLSQHYMQLHESQDSFLEAISRTQAQVTEAYDAVR